MNDKLTHAVNRPLLMTIKCLQRVSSLLAGSYTEAVFTAHTRLLEFPFPIDKHKHTL